MEKKQSSIEWLIEELNHNIEFIPLAHWDKIRDIVQQAKAMHKEEIINAYEDGHLMGSSNLENTGKQHYYETFGGNNE